MKQFSLTGKLKREKIMDEYANWIMSFDENATTDKFKDVDLDRELMDELYDKGLSVKDAIEEYLKQKPEHRA